MGWTAGRRAHRLGKQRFFCFWPGSESPSEASSSEISFSGVVVVNRGSKLINTPNIDTDEEKCPLYSIKFMQGVREIICGGIVEGGAIFCMTRAVECTTSSHVRLKGVAEELPGENN